MSIEDNKELTNITRDGTNLSLWQQTAALPQPAQAKIFDTIYDTVVVGSGITGVSTALLLQKAGKKCIIVDAHHAGFGTTGGTTAHINTFADTSFDQVINDFDMKTAKLFAQAISSAVDLISKQISAYGIDCDFAWKQGFVYAETDEQTKQLDELFTGTLAAGVPVARTGIAPTQAAYQSAVVFENQAQFHPLKYIGGLLTEFQELGGIVQDHTLIERIDSESELHICRSAKGEIKGRNVVYATHIPPGGINVLHFRCAPYRSYVMAVTLKNQDYPDALLYDMQEPYHYLRTHVVDGEKFLIAGGEDHKTGHGDPTVSFANLEAYVRAYYQVDQIVYKWSSQYYVPADGLPYIGKLPGAARGIYAATGFNGNGMILGTASAIELSSLILQGESRFDDIFNPARIKPVAGFADIIRENADVAYHFVADRFEIEKIPSFAELSPASGAVVEYKGQKLAIYKDVAGDIHALSPVCPHAKCIVTWNRSEKSWDCPCHGARFDCDGQVLTGPARTGLERIQVI